MRFTLHALIQIQAVRIYSLKSVVLPNGSDTSTGRISCIFIKMQRYDVTPVISAKNSMTKHTCTNCTLYCKKSSLLI